MVNDIEEKDSTSAKYISSWIESDNSRQIEKKLNSKPMKKQKEFNVKMKKSKKNEKKLYV